MRKVAAVFGTRPEQIKLEPVVEALRGQGVEVEWWWSGQSPDLVEDAERWIPPEMWEHLHEGMTATMDVATDRMIESDLDALLVQGDTATAFAGAVAGFLAEVPVGHVEAGLRTYRREPWPEESFRQAIASFAEWHFCPDAESAENVAREIQEPIHAGGGFPGPIFITGNPVIDTLPSQPFRVLVTLHRRENWGEPIRRARNIFAEFAQDNLAHITVVAHPNWSEHQEDWGEEKIDELNMTFISQGRLDMMASGGSVHHVEPMSHDDFLAEMQRSDLIVTDSGGLQEEAAYLGTDCIVYRSATERTALEASGAIEIVDPTQDPQELRSVLERRYERRMAYGSGDAGEEIAEILISELEDEDGS